MTNPQINPQDELFRKRPETIALAEFLASREVNTVVNYDTLKEAAFGLDVQYRYRHILESCVKALWNEGIFFVNVHGTGVKRLTENAAISTTKEYHQKRFRSDTKRYRNKVEAIDPSKLDSTGRQNHQLAIAELSLRELVGSKATERILQQEIAKRPAQSMGVPKEKTEAMIRGFLDAGIKG